MGAVLSPSCTMCGGSGVHTPAVSQMSRPCPVCRPHSYGRAAKGEAWKAAVAKEPPGPMADALAKLDRVGRKPEGGGS